MEEFSNFKKGRPMVEENQAIVKLWESLPMGKIHTETMKSYRFARDTYNRTKYLIRRKVIIGEIHQQGRTLEMRREG